MKYPRLEPDAIKTELAKLEGWTLREDGAALVKAFKFSSFAEAFGFMAECARCREAQPSSGVVERLFACEGLPDHPRFARCDGA